jgi:hypothetical protein
MFVIEILFYALICMVFLIVDKCFLFFHYDEKLFSNVYLLLLSVLFIMMKTISK